MGFLRKLNLFFRMNGAMKFALFEAFCYLGWARLLIQFPFSKVATHLGDPMQETSLSYSQAQKRDLALVHHAIQLVSQYTPWQSKCLVCAIAALKMLERRGLASTLYLGTAKEDGEFIAHAWLRSGPFLITGAEGMEKFKVVGKFAKLSKGNG